MKFFALADDLIRPTMGIKKVMYPDGDTDDIIKTILLGDRLSRGFTEKLAPALKGRDLKDTLNNVFWFVKDNIKYSIDEPGHEIVKSPGATWAENYADCKSLSVFIGSLLQNLGIRYVYRFASYAPGDVTHVYPVAFLPSGRPVIMDTVNVGFDLEEPYRKAFDIDPKTGHKAKINGKKSVFSYVLGVVVALIAASLLITDK